MCAAPRQAQAAMSSLDDHVAQPHPGLPEGLADYQQFFDLGEPPFDEAIDAYFTAHGRQQLLSQTLHLLHFSETPSFITGPQGSGKSAFVREVVRQLSDQDYVFHLSAPLIREPADLLYELASGIGLAVEAGDALPHLQEKLAEWAQFSEGSLQVFVIIDDAEALSREVIAHLLTLTTAPENNCWHLLCVGSAVALEKFGRQIEIDPAQQFELPEVSAMFVADYLEFRLAEAGYDGPPIFDEEDETHIFISAAGDLNRVHEAAEISLLEKASRATPGPSGLPLWHLGALALLLVVLGVAWWGLESGVDDAVTRQPVALDTGPQSTGGDSASDAGEGPNKNQRPSGATAAVGSPPENVGSTPEEAGQVSARGNAGASLQASSGAGLQSQMPKGQLAEASMSSPDASIASSSAPSVTAGSNANEQAAGAPEADPLMYTGGLKRAEAPVEKPTQPSRLAAAPVARDSGFSDDELHLLERQPTRYTLQVLAAASEAGVQRFLDENAGLPMRVYRTVRAGEPWYVVVLGDYASTQQARAAIQKLPKSLQKSGPWPRDVGSIQQQINSRS
ncbi:SPOR domain-containing protein [Simiduia sp. 21SJ11W-1]|uniref:SPOR domain-containing protein n=1 Tax=Simiduia sp. 21SJ11W-1 TaxID=2909669 RepID=UPI0020A200B8|nr:SPOR domain-containing protein [Simiduia sp. 21SJ11W-1]UTA48562.1 SPOR domain-containing protein [Simiduia sp. 21SJ11W-1]